jgi:hypothetical protein
VTHAAPAQPGHRHPPRPRVPAPLRTDQPGAERPRPPRTESATALGERISGSATRGDRGGRHTTTCIVHWADRSANLLICRIRCVRLDKSWPDGRGASATTVSASPRPADRSPPTAPEVGVGIHGPRASR